MSKEYFDEFEVCYENTHDEIITTQFKREGNRYLDRTVRRAYEVFKVQQSKVEELQINLDFMYKWIRENRFSPTETWLTCDIIDVDEFNEDLIKNNFDKI